MSITNRPLDLCHASSRGYGTKKAGGSQLRSIFDVVRDLGKEDSPPGFRLLHLKLGQVQ